MAALREDGRIVAEKRPYVHSVGHCSRCDTVVEPRLSLQWWVRVETLAKAAGDAVRDGRVVIEPASLARRYFEWVDGLRDWCISRQLWWGHRIPVWYSPDGDDVCFGPDETPPAGWTQDEDVLDTWFSSALWPFSTLGWPDDTADLRALLPDHGARHRLRHPLLLGRADDDVRPLRHGRRAVPFRTVLLHGLVRDPSGKKMSKSRGNVIDPLLWIDTYGADAVRLSLLQGANPGADQAINEEWVVGARNFCTKLWNATRFALLNGATVDGPVPADVSGADAWILSRLHAVIAEVDDALRALRVRQDRRRALPLRVGRGLRLVHRAGEALAGTADRGDTTRRVLGDVLDALLRLLHPLIPFVTEGCGRRSPAASRWSSRRGRWPTRRARRADGDADVGTIQAVVDRGAPVPLRPGRQAVAEGAGRADRRLPTTEPAIRALLRLQEPGDGFTTTASITTARGITVDFDLSGTIDVPAERARLTKDRAAAQKEQAVNAGKLGNEAFTGKAPDAVVAKVRDRLAAAEAELARIDAALAALPPA